MSFPRLFGAAAALGALLGGIIGWLTFSEDDREA